MDGICTTCGRSCCCFVTRCGECLRARMEKIPTDIIDWVYRQARREQESLATDPVFKELVVDVTEYFDHHAIELDLDLIIARNALFALAPSTSRAV